MRMGGEITKDLVLAHLRKTIRCNFGCRFIIDSTRAKADAKSNEGDLAQKLVSVSLSYPIACHPHQMLKCFFFSF